MNSEEQAVHAKMMELEELYFHDLSLKVFKDCPVSLLLRDEDETGQFSYRYCEDIYFSNSLAKWKIRLSDNIPLKAQCNYEIQTIFLKDNPLKSYGFSLLLHEMVHAYIDGLEHIPAVMRNNFSEYWAAKLFRKLEPKVPSLDELLLIICFNKITIPQHGPLFLLKSIDLDIMLQKPLGTHFSYGRTTIFEEIKAMSETV